MAELHGQDGDPGGDGRDLRGDGPEEVRWFRFVRHEDRATFEAQGWVVVGDLGPVHGFYATLMELQGGCIDD